MLSVFNTYLQLLVVLFIRIPGPTSLNVVTVNGLIDEARQICQRHLGVAVHRPAKKHRGKLFQQIDSNKRE